jgi:hypothetical protein
MLAAAAGCKPESATRSGVVLVGEPGVARRMLDALRRDAGR